MACGLPTLAFQDAIADDVLPDCAGLRLSRQNYATAVYDLLDDPTRLQAMGKAARRIATKNYGKFSTRKPLLKMLRLTSAV